MKHFINKIFKLVILRSKWKYSITEKLDSQNVNSKTVCLKIDMASTEWTIFLYILVRFTYWKSSVKNPIIVLTYKANTEKFSCVTRLLATIQAFQFRKQTKSTFSSELYCLGNNHFTFVIRIVQWQWTVYFIYIRGEN